MVIKGRGKFKPVLMDTRTPPTTNITRIASLKKFETHEKALDLLYEIAQLVTPLMNHYGFRVGLLCEFYPTNESLLGLNVNAGQRICLRLRSASNPNWFLEVRDILGTMLHELTHNVYGPHNQSFYKYLEELKDKYFELELNKKGSANLSATSNIMVYKPKNGSGDKVTNKAMRDEQVKRLSQRTLGIKVGKVGSNLMSGNTNKQSLRDLMRDALDRRIPLLKPSQCGHVTKGVSDDPNDDELSIVNVVDLTEDKKKPAEEVIDLTKDYDD